MAKIIKQAKADIYLRDTDSQSLFNNSGVLSFLYFHEWNDCYNPTTGETAQIDGEVYDEATGTYKPNCPDGFIPVFNGRLSALWDNMVACFPDKIQDMYKKMRDNGLSYKQMMKKYKDLWRFWCENLYNADAFGYANTGNFTKAYGDKLQLMDYFFQKRQRYMDSKYCCGSSASNNLRLRLYEMGKGLAIKHYQAIYASLQWGANNFSTQRNIKPGTYAYMPFGYSNTPQDATFDIDDADLITELSTYAKTSSGYVISGLEGLGDFKFDLNMGLLKRLTKFVMDYTTAKPNTKEQGNNFDMSGMLMLKQVIVRNVKNLTKSIVIASDVVEEIDFTGTPVVSVTTPPSDSLVKLVLPATISSISMRGYSNLQTSGFLMAGYSKVDDFEIEDCPQLDTLGILTKCYEAGAPLTNINLKGIDWTLDSMDMLLYLAGKKAKLQGKIKISNSVDVTLAQKNLLKSAFGDIDDPTNSLYVAYRIVEMESLEIKGKAYVDKVGDYAYDISFTPDNANNVRKVSWSVDGNDFATISEEGVLSLVKIGSKDNEDKIHLSVVVTLMDGSTKEASKEVYPYKRSCELGDYLFSDGTYGAELSDNEKCSPVGIVFYLEPVKRRWGLATALRDDEVVPWGLYNSNDAANGMSGIKLNEYTNDVYNTPVTDYTTGYTVTDSAMLNDKEVDNDGFEVYPENSTLGDIGFVTITSAMYQGLASYMKRAGLDIGDIISAGQLKTLRIMKHRDSILSDTAVGLPIPAATSGKTERESLKECISAIKELHDNKAKYQQYYYPAASFGFAYEPTVLPGEELSENLKANHWFLPSMGEMSRLSFYQQHISKKDKYSILAKAYQNGNFRQFVGSWYWSSAEYSSTHAWNFNPQSGQVNGNYGSKCNSYVVRPVVAFKL